MQIGAQFERENEEDLKDQMDFMQLVEPMPGLRTYVKRSYYGVACVPVSCSVWAAQTGVQSARVSHILQDSSSSSQGHHRLDSQQ